MRIYFEDANSTLKSELSSIEFEEVNNDFCDVKITPLGVSIYPDWNLRRVPFVYSDRIDPKYWNEVCKINDGIFPSDQELFKNYPLIDRVSQCVQTVFDDGVLYANIFEDIIPQTQFEEYAIQHNKAVLLHFNYNKLDVDPEEINEQFKHAAYLAPDAYWMSFTYYLNLVFLLEHVRIEEAYDLVMKIERRIAIKSVRSVVLLTLLKYLSMQEDVSNHESMVHQIADTLIAMEDLPESQIDGLTALSQYQETQQNIKEAIVSLEKAVTIAKASDSQQLPYIFASLGDLQLKSAQFGDISQYSFAQHSYQQALKTILKENDAQRYALCQMNLGIIYAEMPIRDVKRHVYAGLAQTAFTEAMQVFNKFDDPYQYAMVCTNFANAMLRLLPDIDKERFEKISFYLFEALNIRRPNQFPEERAITIGTLLNLYFHRIETAEEIDQQWLDEMKLMSEEIISLTSNMFLVENANEAIKFVENTKLQLSSNA
jgi:tetratricopeptide (TPR) repeat protein